MIRVKVKLTDGKWLGTITRDGEVEIVERSSRSKLWSYINRKYLKGVTEIDMEVK